MTREAEANRLLLSAKDRASDAAVRWNAVDLPRIDECIRSLERSAADLTEAAGIIRGTPAEAASNLRSTILDLKRAAFRLERLVDASAAFLRRAPGSIAMDSGVYESDGVVRCYSPVPESRGMQV